VKGKMLRVLHTEASTGWGGQEIRILDESAGLRARGHDVRIAAPAGAQIFSAAPRWNVPVHAISLDRRGASTVRAFFALILELKPDVVCTHSSADSWIATIATRLPGARTAVVRTRHLSTPVGSGILNRWLYGIVPAKVVTTGEAIRSLLINTLSLDPRQVVSVPTGADIDRFRPGDRSGARAKLGIGGGGPVIGIVATLRSWKGHRFLIESLGDSHLGDARLVIVGDGPQNNRLRELAAPFGDRVMFAGQQNDVAPWLQAFDIFALPSTGNEGVPQALLQAMATGLPVVSTPVGAIPELVKDNETGLLVPPEDSVALATAIMRLREEPGLSSRLGASGRDYVVARHTSRAMLDAMEAIFREAAAERR
jgi:glycosyltransferase involved in cell wall biosynthesis